MMKDLIFVCVLGKLKVERSSIYMGSVFFKLSTYWLWPTGTLLAHGVVLRSFYFLETRALFSRMFSEVDNDIFGV